MKAATLFATDAPSATVLVRLAVGLIFLSEGRQKFLFPDTLGVGRIVKLGIPQPSMRAPFVGSVEVVCSALVVSEFLTRRAVLPLIMTMLMALTTTKVPTLVKRCVCLMLVGTGPTSLAAHLAGSGPIDDNK